MRAASLFEARLQHCADRQEWAQHPHDGRMDDTHDAGEALLVISSEWYNNATRLKWNSISMTSVISTPIIG